ncbi:hypothetical protein [Synechococcus sp. R3-13]
MVCEGESSPETHPTGRESGPEALFLHGIPVFAWDPLTTGDLSPTLVTEI